MERDYNKIMDDLQSLQNKEVEVTYQGIHYKGTLIGAGVAEIYLQTTSGQVELPMSGVTRIRAVPERKG